MQSCGERSGQKGKVLAAGHAHISTYSLDSLGSHLPRPVPVRLLLVRSRLRDQQHRVDDRKRHPRPLQAERTRGELQKSERFLINVRTGGERSPPPKPASILRTVNSIQPFVERCAFLSGRGSVMLFVCPPPLSGLLSAGGRPPPLSPCSTRSLPPGTAPPAPPRAQAAGSVRS